MKKLVKKIKKVITKKPAVIGHIERIDSQSMGGWLLHTQCKAIDLCISFSGHNFQLNPQWFYRKDVSIKYGGQYDNAGFNCDLPVELNNFINYSNETSENLKVIANGDVINILCDLPLPVTRLSKEPVLEQSDLKSKNIILENISESTQNIQQTLPFVDMPKGEVEFWGAFVIEGWISNSKSSQQLLTISCNDITLSCRVVRQQRPDINKKYNVKMLESGFSLELPGFLWDHVEDDENAVLIVSDGITALHDEPIILTKEKALEWLTEIALLDKQENKQYFSLLALEHIKFSKLFKKLTPQTQEYYLCFAKEMQLDEYIADVELSSTLVSKEMMTIAPELIINWRAQSELNKRLVDCDGKVFAQVLSTVRQLRLSTEAKHAFFMTIIPLLSKNDELLELRKLTSFSKYYELDQSRNLWELSLVVPLFIVEMQIDRAIKTIWKITHSLDSGWLNTECIFFGISYAQDLEQQGDIDLIGSMQLRYAFLGLLDAFKGGWFSRLHDLLLVRTMVLLLTRINRMESYHQCDLVKAAIKHYGLNPVFWHLIEEHDIHVKNSLLLRAYRHWKCISRFINTYEANNNESILSLEYSIKFFIQQDNPESLIFLREIVANLISNEFFLEDINNHSLVTSLHDTDTLEVLRFVANPSLEKSQLSSLFQDYQEDLFHSLRMQTERNYSELYNVQIEATDALKRLMFNLLQGDKRSISMSYKLVQDCTVPLNSWPGMFLSVDIMATVFSIMQNSTECKEDGVMWLDHYFQEVIACSKEDFFLPPTACTAIATINALHRSEIAESWIQKIKQLIENKFGDTHAPLFQSIENRITTVSTGWPYDTLVVVYSCRKNLNSRIKSIRNSWIKNLEARHIPYVIVVGDGSDTIQGHVLALDTSDVYEDLKHKTLKLFDWVYKNTNAQYILKIDDDCYLDVDRYFDSLSYRKHHYYGRIIHRGIGGMDRTWHHSKSQSDEARKRIDKSPEPSVYADGGGGYCLSRMAVSVLLSNAETFAGRQLIANSFMEDKMVGDLLAMSYIEPSNEDYECYQRRRTYSDAEPIGMMENTFFPSKSVPTKVTHLDSDKGFDIVDERKGTTEFWPKKLWPSYRAPSVTHNFNQLELLTDTVKVKGLLHRSLFVISVMRNEMIMLPHFLRHYRDLGVESFIVVDNCSDDGSREYLLGQSDVVLYSADTEYKYSHYGVSWQQAVLANHCLNKWVLIADADELLVYPGCEKMSLNEYISLMEANEFDCVRLDMIDMYPYGDLESADLSKASSPFEVADWFDSNSCIQWNLGGGQYSNGDNFVSSLRHRLDKFSQPNAFTSQKYALLKYKPWIRLSEGIHNVTGCTVATEHAWFAHFKYHAGFKQKVDDEIKRKQHFDNASEYRRYAAMLSERNGVFRKDGVSKCYKNSQSFMDNAGNLENDN